MRRIPAAAVVLALLAGFAFALWLPLQKTVPSSPLPDLSTLVPSAADVPGWTIKGEVQRFAGDDLYVYIDGGAEIFNEYGFRRVLAQDFENAHKKIVTLEIYEMADSAAAFGIYSFQTSGKGRPAGMGTDSEIEEYYLRFWKGPYLVTITGFDTGVEDRDVLREGVTAIGRATAARIRESAGKPDFLASLPSEWIAPGFKYLRGVLGLNNLYPFFQGDVLKFREAAVHPIEGGLLFLFGYKDAAEAETRLAETGKAMAAEKSYRDVRATAHGRFEAADSKGNGIYARVVGDKIALVLSPQAGSIAEDLIRQIR